LLRTLRPTPFPSSLAPPPSTLTTLFKYWLAARRLAARSLVSLLFIL
jgi:hypothetical protein